jgi:hypothetical protein
MIKSKDGKNATRMIGQRIVFVRMSAIYANPFSFGFSNPFQSHSVAFFDVV